MDIQELLGNALSHQVTQFTFAFGIAAWLHSGRVKKEISTQMKAIVSSIDSIGITLNQKLIEQNARISNIEEEIKHIKERIKNGY